MKINTIEEKINNHYTYKYNETEKKYQRWYRKDNKESLRKYYLIYQRERRKATSYHTLVKQGYILPKNIAEEKIFSIRDYKYLKKINKGKFFV